MGAKATPVVRRLAALVALLLVCATALPPTLHAEMDDLACGFGAAGGTGAPALHEDGADGQASHCEVCHWLRSVRACHVTHQRLSEPLASLTVPVPSAAGQVCAPGLPRRPSRAPPLA